MSELNDLITYLRKKRTKVNRDDADTTNNYCNNENNNVQETKNKQENTREEYKCTMQKTKNEYINESKTVNIHDITRINNKKTDVVNQTSEIADISSKCSSYEITSNESIMDDLDNFISDECVISDLSRLDNEIDDIMSADEKVTEDSVDESNICLNEKNTNNKILNMDDIMSAGEKITEDSVDEGNICLNEKNTNNKILDKTKSQNMKETEVKNSVCYAETSESLPNVNEKLQNDEVYVFNSSSCDNMPLQTQENFSLNVNVDRLNHMAQKNTFTLHEIKSMECYNVKHLVLLVNKIEFFNMETSNIKLVDKTGSIDGVIENEVISEKHICEGDIMILNNVKVWRINDIQLNIVRENIIGIE